jgi:hypothetical protein
MFNTIVGAGEVGAGAASRYSSGSGSDQKMRLLAAPAPQHCAEGLEKEPLKKIMCAAEILRQRPNFSADLAEIICQKLATLSISIHS